MRCQAGSELVTPPRKRTADAGDTVQKCLRRDPKSLETVARDPQFLLKLDVALVSAQGVRERSGSLKDMKSKLKAVAEHLR